MQTEVYEAIYDNVLKYVTAAGLQKNPKIYTEQLLARIYPDVMSYKVGTDAVYEINNINGRPLRADAMNVALALLIGAETPVDDQVNLIPDRYQDVFPYVVPIDIAYKDEVVNVKANDFNFPNINDGTEVVISKSENKNSLLLWGIAIIIIVIGVFILSKKNKK